MAGSTIAKRQANVREFGQLLIRDQRKIESLLAKSVDKQRFLRVCLNAYAMGDKMTSVTPTSVLAACLEAASLSLMPDGVLGEAYLVPFKDKCQLIPGYRGLMQLARRTGEISTIEARVVYENDDFDYQLGLESRCNHKPAPGDRGKVTYVYCIIRLRDGGVQWEVMTKADVDKVRNRSRAGKSGPWVTDYEAMALKTVIKRTLKLCPMSTEDSQVMHRVVNADDQRDVGIEVALDLPDAEPVPAE